MDFESWEDETVMHTGQSRPACGSWWHILHRDGVELRGYYIEDIHSEFNAGLHEALLATWNEL